MSGTLPRHGGQLHAVAESFGMEASRLLDFSANINPNGPPASVLLAMQEYLQSADALTCYPDLEELELRAAIAFYTGCDVNHIVVGNGFVSLLEGVVRATGIASCCVPVPAFNEYRRTLERCGVAVVPLVLDSLSDFTYDVSELLSSGCDAILLANPQNPSGVLTARRELMELVEGAASRGVLVLLDEAFIDYAIGASLTREVGKFPNLVVFRSVTKYFGMPGLRVAYAAAHATVQGSVAACMAPWAISSASSVGVIAALRDEAFRGAVTGPNEVRRELLTESVRALGVAVYPAAANYLLLRLPEGMDAGWAWRRMVERSGVVLRLCEDFEGLPAGHLRLAVRTEEENALAVKALAALFDGSSE